MGFPDTADRISLSLPGAHRGKPPAPQHAVASAGHADQAG